MNLFKLPSLFSRPSDRNEERDLAARIGGHDLYGALYTPEGRLPQLEYAYKAVEKSATVIAMRSKNNIVFGVARYNCPLFTEMAASRTFEIEPGVAFVGAGFWGDCNSLAIIAKQEGRKYRERCDQPMRLNLMSKQMGAFVHSYTLYNSVRPYAATMLLGGWDAEDGPQLYKIEPSGDTRSVFASAAGKRKEKALEIVRKFRLQLHDMNIEELVKLAARILFEVRDEEKKEYFHFDVSVLGEATQGELCINGEKWYQLAALAGARTAAAKRRREREEM